MNMNIGILSWVLSRLAPFGVIAGLVRCGGSDSARDQCVDQSGAWGRTCKESYVGEAEFRAGELENQIGCKVALRPDKALDPYSSADVYISPHFDSYDFRQLVLTNVSLLACRWRIAEEANDSAEPPCEVSIRWERQWAPHNCYSGSAILYNSYPIDDLDVRPTPDSNNDSSCEVDTHYTFVGELCPDGWREE